MSPSYCSVPLGHYDADGNPDECDCGFEAATADQQSRPKPVLSYQQGVQKLVGELRAEREVLLAQLDALRKEPLRTMKDRAADHLADEVQVLVQRRVIDSRSPAGDALLDYREPVRSKRGDRLTELEAELARLRAPPTEAEVEATGEAVVSAYRAGGSQLTVARAAIEAFQRGGTARVQLDTALPAVDGLLAGRTRP